VSRLGKELELYIKLSLLLDPVSIQEWLFPLKPSFRHAKGYKPAMAREVVICARCGTLLGECIGGGVKTSCLNCHNLKITTRFWIVADRLKKEAYPIDIEYELATVLKEIYHGRNRKLQCPSY